jgi:hypothetical protein
MKRMIRLQDVLLQAIAKKTTWRQAAELIAVTDWTMRRRPARLERDGYDGVADWHEGQPSWRRPLPGMLLPIDGSKRRWFQDERRVDLVVILDDATSESYYASPVLVRAERSPHFQLRRNICSS